MSLPPFRRVPSCKGLGRSLLGVAGAQSITLLEPVNRTVQLEDVKKLVEAVERELVALRLLESVPAGGFDLAVECGMATNPNRSNRAHEFFCYQTTATEGAFAQLQPMD